MGRRKPGEVITYTIYMLYDKRLPIEEINSWDDYQRFRCYIGFTSYTAEQRLKDHLKEAFKRSTKTKKLNWIRSIGKENVAVTTLKKGIPTIEEALEEEVRTIAEYKTEWGLSHCLVNGDNGGYGGTKNYSPDVIEKIRQSKIGNTWNIGRVKSKETRKNYP